MRHHDARRLTCERGYDSRHCVMKLTVVASLVRVSRCVGAGCGVRGRGPLRRMFGLRCFSHRAAERAARSLAAERILYALVYGAVLELHDEKLKKRRPMELLEHAG
ncbi:unnamed protein product [Pleuronectes platessa]|uniref:Uncharacterized protein n=1 Tax=Pleuronectes platessa TaxID=8262 RepID=A0A9N7YMZ0_PLEPL|nr:unnamed protein product [Pleuronectes platessa]